MNREAEIRRYFKTHHPETVFAGGQFSAPGFNFGVRKEGDPLIPVLHVYTLFDRTAHLDDAEFGKALLAISEFIDIFYDLTERDRDQWDFTTFDLARRLMIERCPDLEECLAKAWDVQ